MMWIIIILLILIAVGTLLITEVGKKILENIILVFLIVGIIALFVGLFIFLLIKTDVVKSIEDIIIGIVAVSSIFFFMFLKGVAQRSIKENIVTKKITKEQIEEYKNQQVISKKELWYEKYTEHKFISDSSDKNIEKIKDYHVEKIDDNVIKLPWYKRITKHNFKDD